MNTKELVRKVAEKPILFSGEMVQAILDGRKTQTRRVVSFGQFDASSTPGYAWHFRDKRTGCWHDIKGTTVLVANYCPYGRPGDILWVKETFRSNCSDGDGPCGLQPFVEYRCDQGRRVPGKTSEEITRYCNQLYDMKEGWRPSIFMPRWASRITLKVEEVRVQRLQDISEDDAYAEGCGVDHEALPGGCIIPSNRWRYEQLWDSLNKKKHPWSENPWIWAITFSRLER